MVVHLQDEKNQILSTFGWLEVVRFSVDHYCMFRCACNTCNTFYVKAGGTCPHIHLLPHIQNIETRKLSLRQRWPRDAP